MVLAKPRHESPFSRVKSMAASPQKELPEGSQNAAAETGAGCALPQLGNAIPWHWGLVLPTAQKLWVKSWRFVLPTWFQLIKRSSSLRPAHGLQLAIRAFTPASFLSVKSVTAL